VKALWICRKQGQYPVAREQGFLGWGPLFDILKPTCNNQSPALPTHLAILGGT